MEEKKLLPLPHRTWLDSRAKMTFNKDLAPYEYGVAIAATDGTWVHADFGLSKEMAYRFLKHLKASNQYEYYLQDPPTMTDNQKHDLQQLADTAKRLRGNVTKRDLAQHSGISIGTINSLERGTRTPYLKTLRETVRLPPSFHTTHSCNTCSHLQRQHSTAPQLPSRSSGATRP